MGQRARRPSQRWMPRWKPGRGILLSIAVPFLCCCASARCWHGGGRRQIRSTMAAAGRQRHIGGFPASQGRMGGGAGGRGRHGPGRIRPCPGPGRGCGAAGAGVAGGAVLCRLAAGPGTPGGKAAELAGRVAVWANEDYESALVRVKVFHVLGSRDAWRQSLGKGSPAGRRAHHSRRGLQRAAAGPLRGASDRCHPTGAAVAPAYR